VVADIAEEQVVAQSWLPQLALPLSGESLRLLARRVARRNCGRKLHPALPEFHTSDTWWPLMLDRSSNPLKMFSHLRGGKMLLTGMRVNVNKKSLGNRVRSPTVREGNLIHLALPDGRASDTLRATNCGANLIAWQVK